MKFKKGGKAGSLSKKAIPSGVYHRRKVDNRDTVDVRFYEHTNNQDIKEATFRNAVRRYPPPTDGLGSWNAGDVVEVLDGDCWKTATVLKAMCGCYYLVKIIGSARELRLHKVNIRVHQLWQNGKWVIVGKGSGSCEDRVSNKAPNMSCYQKIRSQGGNAENNTGFQESCIVSARTSKRTSPFWSSELEGYTERVRKIRSIEKEGGHEHFVEKGNSWRHACIASKALKMMLGFTTISLAQ